MKTALALALLCACGGAPFDFVGRLCSSDADCGEGTECLPLAAQPICQFKDCPSNGEVFDLGYILIEANTGAIEETDFLICTQQCSRPTECEVGTVCALGVCLPFCDLQGTAYCQAEPCDPSTHKCGNWP